MADFLIGEIGKLFKHSLIAPFHADGSHGAGTDVPPPVL